MLLLVMALTNLISETTSSLPFFSLRSIDWNPLGTMIATGAYDKTLRVWNPERPNVRYSTELKGHETSIEKVAFNPNWLP